MDLGMTVMAGRDDVRCACGFDLLIFEPTILQAFFLVAGLEIAAAPAAAVIVGTVGINFHEICFSHARLDHKAEIFGQGIAKTFTHLLAGGPVR